ncbi:MAG TPA: heme-binding beta-barrel domain-containing protein [Candidatus Dormibacteraeota bacterium]|nr:heme-binding beta-barrel domain-containing protein [Candidatus Dormibacteraeota bacterium]
MGSPPSISDLVAPFSGWLGRWEGEGIGLWRADPPFRYRESLSIEAVPNRALLRLAERTSVLDSGELSHSELGFLRLLPDQAVELLVAVPAGYVELHTGRLQDGVLALVPHSLSVSPTARPLRQVQRTLELNYDVIRTVVAIAVGDDPVSAHVEGTLRRATGTE